MHSVDLQRHHPAERFAGDERLIDLMATAAALREEPDRAREGHRQITLFHKDGLSAVLFDFEAGGRLSHHAADGLVTIQTIAGRVTVVAAGTGHQLPTGSLLVLEPGVVHDVMADRPSQVLLVVHLHDGAPAQP